MTVGDVHFYPYSKKDFENRLRDEKQRRDDIARVAGRETADKYGPNLEKHEAVHSEQWASYSTATAYIAAYGYESFKSQRETGSPAATNSFEVGANLWWGSYANWRPLEYRLPGT